MSSITYIETFSEGPGGWCGWQNGNIGPTVLEWRPGQLISRSPWWIDYNHAPPGAGYMHLLYSLSTFGAQGEAMREVGGANHFITGSFPTNLTDAQFTIKSAGELSLCGTKLLLLIQGHVAGRVGGWLCTGQPLHITDQVREQSIHLTADPKQWTALGARHDRTDMYGVRPLADVLAHVDTSMLLVLYPLDVVPMGPLDGNPHHLRPDRDYPVWRHKLPEGYVVLEEIRIEFA